jgi:hypothetical protein
MSFTFLSIKTYAVAAVLRLMIAEGWDSASNTEFSRLLSFAYRSLKEAVTALELWNGWIHSCRQIEYSV